ncbi:hypothetical protein BD769DRAFT_1668710 [Suillus cothurnatus]|nr:hypothetical protein BD769DRAFT_1668710 [Suillus cothurnatus]
MPPRPSSTPSDIAAHKRNTQKKVEASQRPGSTGEKDDSDEKPLQQRSSKVKALERKVWNETVANTHKRAPTVTALQSVPAANEYGDSEPGSEKSDDNMEVPHDDDLDLLSQEELMKEIPHFVPPRTARSASTQSQTSSNVSKLSTMASSDDIAAAEFESDSEMLFADKPEDGHCDGDSGSQRSKTYYREPSSIVTNLKHQPGKKKSSKLEARQELERPRFVEVKDEALPANATHEAASKLESDKDSSGYTFMWPTFTDLVYSADGSINLKAQNTRIQNVLKTAVLELKKASIFDNAFPNITQKRKMALESVDIAAGKHKEYAISKRIKNDFDYAVALAGVPEARLSSFRTNLKKLAHQIVVSRFALKKGCADQVEDLIKSHKYIFPVDAKGKVLGDQPFCDESIIDTIHLSFFDGENSIGVQSRDDFVSVLDGNDEPELPVAMVCLITTLIYAILKDWSSGNPPSSAQVKSFNSSFHIGVYKAHQATLTRIFNSSQKKYHALMARLYKAVSTVESSAPTGSSDTCDYLDLDAMGED